MYKLTNNIQGQLISILKSNADGSGTSIPIAPDNTDYQAYLKWVAEGNTPLPADEPTA
jgi:hypothetical protein